MLEVKYIIDQYGSSRAVFEPSYAPLSIFLEYDVQGSLFSCDEFLSICNDIRSGKMTKYDGVGNAQYICIKKEGVHIECEYDENAEPCFVSLDDFEHAVQGWKQFILKRKEQQE